MCIRDRYRRLSSQFFELISTYSPLLEIASIDECYVDFSNYIIEHNIHPYKLAKIIQNDVLNTLKLKCSIGTVSYTHLYFCLLFFFTKSL